MKSVTQKTLVFALILISTALANCGKKTADEQAEYSADVSSSGVVAGAIGGALSDSSAGGTQASYKFQMPAGRFAAIQNLLSPLPKASAAGLCPTFRTTGAGCSTSGGHMWLSYNSCSFAGHATWTGVQDISMSTGSASCGSFPNPGASGTLYRQYVQASGASTPGSISLDSDSLSATIDDAVADLGNFDNQSIAAINGNGGYGTKVMFNAQGARSSVTLGHRLQVSGILDHSVIGTVTVSEASGAGSRTLNGTVTVYHNRLRVVGTSTLSNIVHSDLCCLPVGGTITTTYADGQNVHATALGQLLIGKSETLTFTGCGTANLAGTDGSSIAVTLHRCF